MSLLPYVFNDAWNDPFTRLYDQHFGLGLLDDDISLSRPSLASLVGPLRAGYLRTQRPSMLEESGISAMENEKDRIKINLDVQQFKPEEVTVKVADDYLIVEGKHEEKQDEHGYVSRQFTRRYRLPDSIVKEKIGSFISTDGVLQIVAPKKQEAIENQKEREIPIVRTNAPAIKQQQKKNNKGDKMES